MDQLEEPNPEQLQAAAAEVLVEHLRNLGLAPLLYAPADKVTLPDIFKLIRAALNKVILTQRKLAVSVAAVELVLSGFPGDLAEGAATTLLETLSPLDEELRGRSLTEMLRAYSR